MRYIYWCEDEPVSPQPRATALLGGKGASLVLMKHELGLPVPPWFTITTTAARQFLAHGWPTGLAEEIEEHMGKLERVVGRRLGDPDDPLLVSVRSGAPVSMPGMMDTILNLGLTSRATRGLAAVSADPVFAVNCRRRLEDMFANLIGEGGVPEDPREQLRVAVETVFRSWNTERARAYREHEGIQDDLGTAVTVQAMVFGNRGPDSGTGVLFSRNPATGEPGAYGDFLFNAQGEDVVAGTHRTDQLAELGRRMPVVFSQLTRYAEVLEHHFADLCDIEFTVERGVLWLLQSRVGKRSPLAEVRMAVDMANDDRFPVTRADAVHRTHHWLAEPPMQEDLSGQGLDRLTVGLAASPGVASGQIATSAAMAMSFATAGHPVILTREHTSPDDVPGMSISKGILTSNGGLVSHAAVVARGWGIPAVVGATELDVHDDGVVIAGRSFAAGDVITLNGATGEVFAGEIVAKPSPVAEVEILRAWAAECGVSIAGRDISTEDGDGPWFGDNDDSVELDDVIRCLSVKGFATSEALTHALIISVAKLETMLRTLSDQELVAGASGAIKLTERGRLRAAERVAADRSAWGTENATAALDTFLALDQRMKEAVTAWQLRDPEDPQSINDHSDAGYDREVIARLEQLHGDSEIWLAPRSEWLRGYLDRLRRALAMVQSGDIRYVASPRVDSYHTVWFEMHENLIILAGRDRASEVAAGRA